MPLGTMRAMTNWTLLASVAFLAPGAGWADEKPALPAKPNGKVLLVRGVIDSAQKHRVLAAARNVARDGLEVLILDLQASPSEFDSCFGLASELAKLGGSIRRKIAYISKPMPGHAALVALACDEIVMADQAWIGDIDASDNAATEETAYADIARRQGHNTALAKAFVEKKARLLQVETPIDKRVILEADLDKLVREGLVVNKKTVVKEAGETLRMFPTQGKRLGLIRRSANSRAEVASAYGLSEQIAVEDPFEEARKPVVLRIEGSIDGTMHQYVLRRMKQAQSSGYNLVFVEIDSTTGDETSAINIAESLRSWAGVKKVAWVPRQCLGPATLVIFGCDELVAAPKAKIGDFRPNNADAKEGKRFAEDVAPLAGNGRFPPALVRGMVDINEVIYEARSKQNPNLRSFKTATELDTPEIKEVWEKSKPGPIKDKGAVLQVDGVQALSMDLAVANASSQEELLSQYSVGPAVVVLQSSWVDSLVVGLRSGGVSFFLLMVGFACLWLELQIPGFGVAGLISAVCFALFFWANWMADTAGSLEIIMFLLGLSFLAIEIFVLPGFGITGLAGVSLIIGSLILASQSFIVPRTETETREFLSHLGTMGAIIVAMGVFATALSRYFPRLPFFNRMVLSAPDEESGTSGTLIDDEYENPNADLLGARGVAMTPIRPAGRVAVGERFVDVVSQGEFIESGAPIEVIDVFNNRVVVRGLTEAS